MRAARAVIEILRDEGVDRVFGNAGTTELPLLAELADAPGIAYVLGLQEASVVAMADGYARATGGVGFANLHVAAGLANGLSNILNATRSRIPLVITAGQQDTRHLDHDPFLAGDLVALAAPTCKSAVEVHRAADVPAVLRRAFLTAVTPPAGPVFVSLPMDLLLADVGEELPGRSARAEPGAAGGITEAAATLRGARAPALVIGDGVGREDAVGVAVALAEALRADVHGQPFADRVGFPARHRLFRGALEPVNAGIRRALDGHDVVFVIGAHAFAPHYYTATAAVASDTTLIQLDSDPGVVGRNYPVAHALIGGIRPSLEALVAAIGPGGGEAHTDAPGGDGPAAEGAAADGPVAEDTGSPSDTTFDAAAAAAALAGALPPDAVVVEEAVTSAGPLRRALAPERPGAYHRAAGGGLGWGLGAAVGFALGAPAAPVVAALGDGAAMYGIQGLWTAARAGVDVTFVIFNNRRYHALRRGFAHVGLADVDLAAVPGTELTEPSIDWPALAGSLGVDAVSVTDGPGLQAAVRDAAAADGPRVIDARLSE
jgi:benzoylformate decarboxylase